MTGSGVVDININNTITCLPATLTMLVNSFVYACAAKRINSLV